MRLSPLAYYADVFIAVTAIVYLAVETGSGLSPQNMASWLGAAAAGFAFWTIFEYWVHRILYHNVPFFKEQHDAHHAAPNAFIGAPPVLGIVMIFCLSYLPFVSVSVMAASGLTIGMLTGYLAYMLLHHAAHHWNVAPESWLYRLRRHHALHHHSRIDGNYGITTSFWDIVFGTSLAPRRTRFRFKLR